MRELNNVIRKPVNEKKFSNAKRKFEAAAATVAILGAASLARAEGKVHKFEVERYSPGPVRMIDNEVIGSEGNNSGMDFDHEVNPRAHNDFTLTLGGHFPFGKNPDSFVDYIESGAKSYSFRLMGIGAAMTYERFRFADHTEFSRENPSLRGHADFEGWGGAVSLTPSFVFAGGVERVPYEIDVYLGLTSLSYNLEYPVLELNGTRYDAAVFDSKVYPGNMGLELRFPSVVTDDSKPGIVRGERLGVGMLGEPDNVFTYATGSINSYRTTKIRLRSYLTAQYAYLADVSSYAVEALPLEFGVSTYVGDMAVAPGLKLEYIPDHDATHLEWFGEGKVSNEKLHYNASIRMGCVEELAGHGNEPVACFTSLNFIVHTR